MNKRIRLVIGVLPLLLLACGKGPGPSTASTEPAATSASAAKPAPTKAKQPGLQVTTLEGAQWDLAAQRGKWVVVNYWATWCGPCIQEMPELSALAAMRAHISVIGLAYDEASVEELQAFLRDRPVTYPIARIDIYEPPADFGAPRGLPTTWLIAPDGKLARKYTGPLTARMLEEDIAAFGGPKAG